MNTTRLLSRPGLALAAASLLVGAATGASAAGTASARVDVVAPAPVHACPSVDDELADALAGAWDDAAKPSAVEVRFELHHHSVYGVTPSTDSARTFHQIRHAVHGLRCDGGDDAVHTVRFVVQFVERGGEQRVAMAARP